MSDKQQRTPDYSNLPSRVDFVFLIAAICIFFVSLQYQYLLGSFGFIIGMMLSEFFLLAFAILSYLNTVGARRVCKLMVSEAQKILTGDETILDVGTGSGMLLISLAKFLNRGGKAFGVDVWESTVERKAHDRSLRTRQLVLDNAAIEGVGDRVTVIGGDPRNLPYKTDSIDIVVSMKLFHHMSIGSVDRTLVQMTRVCKPNGYLYIHDFMHLHRIRTLLTKFGMKEVKVITSSPFFPIAKFVIFQKPASGIGNTLAELDSVQKAEKKKTAMAERAGVHLASISPEEAKRLEAIRQAEKEAAAKKQ